MPISKYTLIGKIVFSICKMDSSKLRKIASELSVLSKVKKIKKVRKTKRKSKSRKIVGKTYTAKNGRKYKIMSNGRARFI
tara:strand:- start:748 stop:987 length:240 start_codon:yes stop_codon:yes gene_type:complete